MRVSIWTPPPLSNWQRRRPHVTLNLLSYGSTAYLKTGSAFSFFLQGICELVRLNRRK
uniref:Uncharacterized protein n=1 Tax=Anguilla anguilla TaxID=7936 RepID=A0A0E9TMH9_ANGAN